MLSLIIKIASIMCFSSDPQSPSYPTTKKLLNFWFAVSALGKNLITTSKNIEKGSEMRLSDEKTLAIGAISLALGILIGRFIHFEWAGFSVTDFVEGVLIGLSLVMNIAYLIRKRKK